MLNVYSIAASGTFERDFKKLDASIQKRIDKKLLQAAANPEMHLKILQHMPPPLRGLRRLRVGDYRVLLWVNHTSRTLTLYAVEHRSSVYQGL